MIINIYNLISNSIMGNDMCYGERPNERHI